MKTLYILLLVFLMCFELTAMQISEIRIINGKIKSPNLLNTKDYQEMVYEKDKVLLTIIYVPSNAVTISFRLQKVAEMELPPIIRYGQYINKVVGTLDTLSIPLIELKGDKKYYYELKSVIVGEKDTSTQCGFFLEVHAMTHLEASIGPVFSWIRLNNFVTTPFLPSGDSLTIKNNNSVKSLSFVLGAVVHPWGYDQRATLGARNILFFFGLGINDKEKIWENIFIGAGYGFRGINLIIGSHIAFNTTLIEGYVENGIYASDRIPDIDKITTKNITFGVFASVSADAGAFLKIFSNALGIKL